MSGFTQNGAELDRVFITEKEFLDRYSGNQLYAWGASMNGTLGTGNYSSYSSPVNISGTGTSWASLAKHDTSLDTYGYSYPNGSGIKTDGSLWVWGYNNYGQLGTNNVTAYTSPTTVAFTAGVRWKKVTMLWDRTHAIRSDGTLWSCGYNNVGQLGINSVADKSSITQVSGGGTWTDVSSGRLHTVAIKSDGTLWGWGDGNAFGKITTIYSSPTQIGTDTWKQISCHYDAVVGIKTDGTLWGCGYLAPGWNNSAVSSQFTSFVQVTAGGTNWGKVSCGYNHVAAIKTDGTLWGWGWNFFGAYGTNNTTTYSSPITVSGGGTNWKQVSCGSYFTAAIKTDGSLWVCGYNSYGQLGINSKINYSSPIQHPYFGNNWVQVSASEWCVHGLIQP